MYLSQSLKSSYIVHKSYCMFTQLLCWSVFQTQYQKKPVLPQIDSIRQTQNAFHQRKQLSKHACSQNDFRSSIAVYHTIPVHEVLNYNLVFLLAWTSQIPYNVGLIVRKRSHWEGCRWQDTLDAKESLEVLFRLDNKRFQFRPPPNC